MIWKKKAKRLICGCFVENKSSLQSMQTVSCLSSLVLNLRTMRHTSDVGFARRISFVLVRVFLSFFSFFFFSRSKQKEKREYSFLSVIYYQIETYQIFRMLLTFFHKRVSSSSIIFLFPDFKKVDVYNLLFAVLSILVFES